MFYRQTSIACDSTHGECIYGIVSGDGHDPQAIGHDDMFALTRDSKADFFESADGIKVIDTWDARQD